MTKIFASPFSEWGLMEIIAFGRQVADPTHSALDEITLALSCLPRRYKRCDVAICMRGSSVDYDDWVTLSVSADSADLELACVNWITQQATRRGYAIVPKAL